MCELSETFDGCQSLDEIQDKLEGKENVNTIVVTSNNLTWSGSVFQKDYPELDKITINNCNIGELQDRFGFFHIRNLRYLEITNNTITGFGDSPFFYLSSLFSLNLSNNSLEQVQDDVFKGLERLGSLVLKNNCIKTISRNAFQNLRALSNLELPNNAIEELDENVFQDLVALRCLILKFNKLKTLGSQIFAPLKDLAHLDVSHNELLCLPQGLLSDRAMDGYLVNFSFNKIEQIEESALSGLFIRAGVLDLGHNHLCTLKSGVLSKVMAEVVILTGNKIENIEKGAFSGCTCTDLYLNENRLTTVTPDIWEGLQVHSILSLSKNEISSYGGAFVNCTDLGLRLDLDHNKIKDLPDSGFEGLTRVVTLSLNDNLIQKVDEASLVGLPKLYTLGLHNNQIEELHEECFSSLPRLSDLFLGANKLNFLKPELLKHNSRLFQLVMPNNNFTNLPSPEVFSCPESLMIFNFFQNRIEKIAANSFSAAKRRFIQLIQLESNQISDIEPGAFNGIEYIKYLALNSNNIASLHPATFQGLGSIHRIELDNNLTGYLKLLPPTTLVLFNGGPPGGFEAELEKLALNNVGTISFASCAYQREGEKWNFIDHNVEDMDEKFEWEDVLLMEEK
ncbi:hypothetical protein PPYR_02001 [Photinus pyralis]|uniref:LRRCT domain-containing protein n=1 Tax=Photinus pyralis TaxID=7054 RepID=A0A5N4B5Z0_PHOPY|nr:slit homolog 2 protein-like [Photinus pyralis]XP_031353896.1 slit homolog 2 protein-like [Photinus pyralis]XP_031353903.1 slit homolog 2 protein-like [Photinus pyralis]XP_031353912.1 slit homolog 2 protein-like [Photinus pyralis]KAB0805031.1 hypothetical protein PPYR_02001 [Photinus pyralis]